MRRALTLSAVAAVLVTSQLAAAFTFELPAKKYRCFTEEIVSNTPMELRYTIAPGYAQVVDVKLTDPNGVTVLDESATNKGSYTANVVRGGDFAVCFYSRMSSGVSATEGMSRMVTMSWHTGTDQIDYSALASTTHLKPMELHLRTMIDSVRSLHAQYEYLKEREELMRETNEHVNARVMWLGFLALGVFCGFGYFQVAHLKRYFKRKRMID